MRSYILDQDGEPQATEDFVTWGRWLATADRNLAKNEVNGMRISTVFLGMDCRFGHGPPLLWETMVFGGPLDEEMERYTTKQDAFEGHARWVERCHNVTKTSASRE